MLLMINSEFLITTYSTQFSALVNLLYLRPSSMLYSFTKKLAKMSRKESFMMSYYKVKKNPGVEDRKFQKDVNMKTSFYDSFLLPLSIPSNQSASHFQGLKQGMARKMTVSREKNLICLAQQTEMSWCCYITNTFIILSHL